MYCSNCGKKGHYSKNCPYPTNSYGCIVYKIGNDHQIRILMIQRKYTYEYIDLLRGKYYYYDPITSEEKININYLNILIHSLSLIEINYICNHSFDDLWKKLWIWEGTNDQLEKIQNMYVNCKNKFNKLINGFLYDTYGYIKFTDIIKSSPNHFTEPTWELPKGKKKMGENDQQSAIRETCEETSLNLKNFRIDNSSAIFKEYFNANNGSKYCNNYLIAKLIDDNISTYYDPTHIQQNAEIRKIGWFSIKEIYSLIDIRQSYKFKLINDVFRKISSLNQTTPPTDIAI